ncbi:MAG: L,D-transpeptidase [Chitinophagales bacterium]|nr:L,D-transpeptidase [Chitinophagales bacterium]
MILFLFCLSLFFQTETTIQSTSQLLQKKFNYTKDQSFLLVNIQKQEMYLVRNDTIKKNYHISSAKNGIGNTAGSGKTPLGVHRIAEKIGNGAKPNTIFLGRKDAGKTATILKEPIDSEEDYVTSRILWLEGMEPGINKGKGIDSKQRYIYIHGTPEEGLIGTPASHGCIRMYNKDVIELFDLVNTGTLVVMMEKVNP